MIKRKHLVLSLLVVIIFFFIIYTSLPGIYNGLFNFLSISDDIHKSDIIFCVSGELTFRLPIVIDLYKKQMADKIIYLMKHPEKQLKIRKEMVKETLLKYNAFDIAKEWNEILL